jgi:[ribosomal protein S18]-alanine N-acetyltransferase
VTVRPAVASDLPAIRGLDVEVFGADAWSESAWRGERDQMPATRHVVVALDADRVVGFAVLSAVGEVADLHRVAVASDRRRRGVGASLVDALLAEARSRRCDRLLLEVESDNEPALAMYGWLGFVEIARRRAYYGPIRDALVLELRLS